MNGISERKSFLIPAAALIAVFIISLLTFLIGGGKEAKRVLFFPDDMSGVIKGETRYLPVYGTEEENITLLVRELLLGPYYLMYDRSAPKETKLNTAILNGDKLFLDFSVDIAASDKNSSLNFDEVNKLIKKTVTFNFKNVRTVNITVDGQIPGSAYYAGGPDK